MAEVVNTVYFPPFFFTGERVQEASHVPGGPVIVPDPGRMGFDPVFKTPFDIIWSSIKYIEIFIILCKNESAFHWQQVCYPLGHAD